LIAAKSALTIAGAAPGNEAGGTVTLDDAQLAGDEGDF
jgi:hypothetical protein